MNVLTGIQNFLQYINDNWTAIIVIVGLLIAICKKAKNYFGKSNEEKVNIAKKYIQETILKMVTDAEEDYQEWIKAGAVKRAQVIEKVFLTYPILSKAANQEELIAWIDDAIDDALKIMRNIVAQNTDGSVDNNGQQK